LLLRELSAYALALSEVWQDAEPTFRRRKLKQCRGRAASSAGGHRFEFYIRSVRTQLQANTASIFKWVTGYIVADKLSKDSIVIDKLISLGREEMYAMDWSTLLSQSARKVEGFSDCAHLPCAGR